MERIETVVVGGGLAGLCAARDLLDTGRQVVLLEARDRVGGRTYSVPFEAAGLTVDLGAEWVDPLQHQAMMQELARYGIDLESAVSKMPPQPLSPESGAISWRSIVRICDRIAAQLNSDQPHWYEGFDEFDVPVSAFLASHALDDDDLTAFLAHGFALQGAHPDDYSMLNLLHEFAAFGGVEAAFNGAESRIAGGRAIAEYRYRQNTWCSTANELPGDPDCENRGGRHRRGSCRPAFGGAGDCCAAA